MRIAFNANGIGAWANFIVYNKEPEPPGPGPDPDPNPNPDPDGPGTRAPEAVSSWQLLAADIDVDGRVTRSDAYSLLKAAAGEVRAPLTQWIFTDESIGSSNITRDDVPTPMPTEISLQADTDVRWLGVLLGDVDGSWGG